MDSRNPEVSSCSNEHTELSNHPRADRISGPWCQPICFPRFSISAIIFPSFSHHFPMFPSFSHVCCHDIDIPPGTPTSGPTLAPPVPGLVAPWVTWRDGGSGTHVNHVTLW